MPSRNSASNISKCRRRPSASGGRSAVSAINLNIEGIELEAFEGARQTIERNRPVVLVESIKAGRERLRAFLDQRGYTVVEVGINLLAIHKTPVVTKLQIPELLAQSSAA